MIHAQTINGGRSQRDALIFATQDSRHGELPSAREVQQEKYYFLFLLDIWARRLDIGDFNLPGLI